MPDRWIDVTYVDAFLGSSVRSSLTSDSGASLLIIIEAATAVVQGFMRAAGYVIGSGITATDANPAAKAAIMACVWEMLADRPKFGVKLPDNWDDHPLKIAFDGIRFQRDRGFQIDVEQSTSASPGGALFDSNEAKADTDSLGDF